MMRGRCLTWVSEVVILVCVLSIMNGSFGKKKIKKIEMEIWCKIRLRLKNNMDSIYILIVHQL